MTDGTNPDPSGHRLGQVGRDRIFDAADPAWATIAVEYRRGPKPRPTNGIMFLAELGGRSVGAARASEALDGLTAPKIARGHYRLARLRTTPTRQRFDPRDCAAKRALHLGQSRDPTLW